MLFLSRNVRCDREMRLQIFFLQKYFCEFVLVIMLDHLIVRFSDRSISLFSEWRMSVLDYRVTYVCSRSVERRLWWDVKLNEMIHQTWRERLIKFDESDSSNFDEKTSSHQTWRKDHLIKFEFVISSNFLKRKTVSLLFDERSHAATRDMRNLVLQRITFVLCKDKCFCVRLRWWMSVLNESWTLM